MPEFLTLTPPMTALELLLGELKEKSGLEWVELKDALGRITAEAIIAPHALPAFSRSAMDGYAVRASDTFGASEGLPAYLRVVGEIAMGAMATMELDRAQCALIHTGGMLPASADAVVMLEYTQGVKAGEVEILKAVAPGENVIRVGEDVESGQEVIQAGSKLRPAEIGGLAALGISRVAVMGKPRVAIIATGDEVVPLNAEALPGQVHDVNTYSLGALVEQSGGTPISYGIVPDQVEMLERTARQALEECDIVTIVAGSSASTRDFTSQVINGLGAPGVLVHGVSIRPGKPTILGVCDGKAVIGLPGNPVSALVIAGLFIAPIIEQRLGVTREQPRPSVQAKLLVNVPSQAGREDWIPVRLHHEAEGWEADPVFGKSNLIFTLARADGLVRIPQDATGLQAGEVVEVFFIN